MAGARSTAARDLEALKLRQAGMSFDDIASTLGFANRGSAHKAFRRALEARSDTAVLSRGEAQQMELARLDYYTQLLTVKAQRGDLSAMDRLLKISNQRAKMLALYDAPARSTAWEGPAADAAGNVIGPNRLEQLRARRRGASDAG